MRSRTFIFLIAAFVTAVGSTLLAGEVKFDGSLGAAGALSGPNFLIPADRGRQVGGNLFHSFSDFHLIKDDVASFQGPSNVQNILARVTGGSASNIDGTVRSTIVGANLFLMNPAGVFFGPNASVDVSGSFAVTTADHLKLADGGRFEANLARDSVLTAAPVEAFGFLSSTPAKIALQGTTLGGIDANTIAIVGGDIETDQATIVAGRIHLASVRSSGEVCLTVDDPLSVPATGSFAQLGQVALRSSLFGANKLVIRGGKLTVSSSIAVAATNPVDRDQADFDLRESVEFGSGGQLIAATTANFGESALVRIAAPRITLEEESIIETRGFTQDGVTGIAGTLRLDTGVLEVLSGARLIAQSFDRGAGGAIEVFADQITVAGAGSAIQAGTNDPIQPTNGPVGDVRLTITGRLNIFDGAKVTANTTGEGQGGNIKIDADTVLISPLGNSESTGIRAETFLAVNGGTGGNVTVTAREAIGIFAGGQVTATTYGSGDGGAVSLNAPLIVVEGAGVATLSGVSANTLDPASGHGGNVSINAGQLQVLRGAQVSVGTSSSGPGGSMGITADSVRVAGLGPTGTFAGINANTLGRTPSAVGGDVQVVANQIDVIDGEIGAGTSGPARGGNVRIFGGDLRLDTDLRSFNGIQTLTGAREEGGVGGDIEIILTGSVTLRGSAFINASTYGSGNGGSVTINASDLSLVGAEDRPAPAIQADSGGFFGQTLVVGRGSGGSVSLRLRGDLRFETAGIVSASTYGPGTGGKITICARNVIGTGIAGIIADSFDPVAGGRGGDIEITASDKFDLNGGGFVRANTAGPKPGGRISVSATEAKLANGSAIASGTRGIGRGGNIAITADDLVLVGGTSGQESLIATTTFGRGNAGDIDIAARRMEVSGTAGIDAATRGTGNGGDITIDTGNLVIRGTGGERVGTPGFPFSAGIAAGSADPLSLPIPGPGGGNAGRIEITTDSLEIMRGGGISVTTETAGRGGNLRVTAGTISIDGMGAITSTGLVAQTLGTIRAGNGGNIDIDANRIDLKNGGSIQTTSEGTGAGGSLGARLGSLAMANGGLISSAALDSGSAGDVVLDITGEATLARSTITVRSAAGDAGSITLRTSARLTLRDSAIVAEAGGSGGNILVGASFLDLDSSRISANAVTGDGGLITLAIPANGILGGPADYFIVSPFVRQSADSRITASSEQGLQGALLIQAPDLDLTGGLAALSVAPFDSSSQLREQCARRLGLDFSSFLVIGRGGVSLTPDDTQTDSGGAERRRKKAPAAR